MINYSIDELYNEGHINGEVFYLCEENGISYLSDAVPSFSEQDLPNYLEELRLVYNELSKEPEASLPYDWTSWKDDCYDIAKSHFGYIQGIFFNSFVVFIKYVQSQNWLFGQYYCSGTFKDEIENYWKSKQPETVDEITAPWRSACKQYLAACSQFERRTLSSLIDLYPTKDSFIADLRSPSFADEVIRIKSFGQSRKALISDLVPKFLNCLESLGSITDQESRINGINSRDESWLMEFFKDSLKAYSVRANNALDLARKLQGSYSSFFKWILSPEFIPQKLRNVGRKTVIEINEWREYVIEFLASPNKDNHDGIALADEIESLPSNIASPKNLFDDFFCYLESLTGAKQKLAYYIAESTSISGLNEIADNISVTRERVRQLIPVVIKDLGTFFSKQHKSKDYSREEFLIIADNCGHCLNNEFKMWAGSFVSSEISIVGSFEKYILKHTPIIVVDGKLASIIDFSKFISKIDSLNDNKYYEETKVNIEDIILDCFTDEVQFEYLQAANRACRAILYEYYPYHLTEREIIIPANAYYSIRQRVEDILEREGKALSIGQIRTRLSESGASFDGSDNQLVSMIRKSALVVSYGYPTKYGLSTWGKPEEDSYGTIRDVAIHILLTHEPHILPEKDLLSALLAVYSESNERSIFSNLMADSKQRFGLYQKGSMMYIGLTNEVYDSSYVLKVKGESKKSASATQQKVSWQGTFDSVKQVLSSHSWTALDEQQRKWLINNWKKAQRGSLQEWQTTQIIELIEKSKKR